MRRIGKIESGNVLVEMSPVEWRRMALANIKPENLGTEMATHRRKIGLSQKEFAMKVGISRNRLSEIERGVKPEMSMRTFQRIMEMIS
jgi:DNA-binding XRE family transcriptional regulator